MITSEFHVYHSNCLEKLMELDEKFWKCIICKAPLPKLDDTYEPEDSD